jgi:GAF domain-containing protein
MMNPPIGSGGTIYSAYRDLLSQLSGLIDGESDVIANASNMASVIYHGLPDLNWAGFYFLHHDVLVLGPFQGKPACLRIPIGQGVCGSAVERRESILVNDVHRFPGHIACDAASLSELVVPLIVDDRVLGVLDLDSPVLQRFRQSDRVGCEALARCFLDHQRRWPEQLRRLSG